MIVLTLNAGSNSLKFEIVAAEAGGGFGSSLAAGAYDNIGKDHSVFALLKNKRAFQSEEMEIRDYEHATNLLFDWIEHGGARSRGIGTLADIHQIAHRVVHGADNFSGPEQITDEVIRQIEALQEIAPLHNVSALQAIRAAQARTGSRVPMVAIFDTVFHRTIPDEAAFYPIPVDFGAAAQNTALWISWNITPLHDAALRRDCETPDSRAKSDHAAPRRRVFGSRYSTGRLN
jgi:acetate kinase